MAKRLERGDVYLHRFAPPDKERPVVILTRSSAIPYLIRVTVAPITSSIRGNPAEVYLDESDGMKGPCAVSLQNLVTIDKRALGKRVCKLGQGRMRGLCAALGFALGCDDAESGAMSRLT